MKSHSMTHHLIRIRKCPRAFRKTTQIRTIRIMIGNMSLQRTNTNQRLGTYCTNETSIRSIDCRHFHRMVFKKMVFHCDTIVIQTIDFTIATHVFFVIRMFAEHMISGRTWKKFPANVASETVAVHMRIGVVID